MTATTTRTPVKIERLGEDEVREGFTETLGEAPCPTPGCRRKGVLVRVATRRLTLPCRPCGEKIQEAQDAEERAEVVARLMARSGGTARMERFTLDSYPDDEAGRAAKATALRWRDMLLAATTRDEEDSQALRTFRDDSIGERPSFFIHGPIGGGKTGLLWPIIRELNEQLLRSRMVDFPTVLEQMKDAFKAKVSLDQFTDLGTVPVLALDDVGAERPTEWARGQLLQLVNTRYERCLPTAYISNYEPGQLVHRLGHDDLVVGERIVSRMLEGSLRHRVKAPDRRAVAK